MTQTDCHKARAAAKERTTRLLQSMGIATGLTLIPLLIGAGMAGSPRRQRQPPVADLFFPGRPDLINSGVIGHEVDLIYLIAWFVVFTLLVRFCLGFYTHHLRMPSAPLTAEGTCRVCGYSARGLRDAVCPECGADLKVLRGLETTPAPVSDPQ